MQLTSNQHSTSLPAGRPQPPAALAAIGLAALTATVFVVDRNTGLPHVQHLYYLPIILAAMRFGTVGGTAAAIVAIALYHLANPQAVTWPYEESDALQMAVFVAVAVVAARLADDARRLHQLAMTDDLTGLHNLRSFELELRTMMRRARAAKSMVSLLVLDLDRLKTLNDEYGHLAGAEAVRTVGGVIAEQIPADAVACRYGGDEFVIALPRNAGEAQRLADDLRRAVLARDPVLAGVQFAANTLSISVGLACRSFDDAPPAGDTSTEDEESETLFRTADAALYAAKSGGRNRVHVA